MLKYNFGIYQSKNPVTNQDYITPRLGVEDPYWMLSYIGDIVNDALFIDEEILPNLLKVINGELEHYDWGCDMALIYSYKDKSTIEYLHDSEKGVEESYIDIPTVWLINLIKDWRDYLKENSCPR